MTAKIVDQKEYLKKYLSGKDKDKKKKKKKLRRIIGDGLKVIDDDVDISQLKTLDESELDLFYSNEDAPQIVGVIDERAPDIKTLNDYRASAKWKVVDNDKENSLLELEKKANIEITNRENNQGGDDEESDARSIRKPKTNKTIRDEDSDVSPPRRKKTHAQSEYSPARSNLGKNNRDHSDSDNSPERQPTRLLAKPHRDERRNRNDNEHSPARKNAQHRSRASSRNFSPPRINNVNSRRSHRSDSDNSPPRKANRYDDTPNNSRRRQHNSSMRQTPRYSNREDNAHRNRSPRSAIQEKITDEVKITNEANRTSVNRWEDHQKNPNFSNSHERSESNRTNTSKGQKMFKTLDGKTAGLQDARSLKVEAEAFRTTEKDLFEAMGEEETGRNAETIVRDRKTGRKRDLSKERQEDKKKQENNKVRNEKYTRWGKGLKQVEEQRARLETEAHEMAKPLARYANDGDLEQHLKSQFHAGDPMLEYMRRKDMEEQVKKGIEVKPKYQGSYPANRFDIRPGYRWDGVDRSIGYEKRFFETINSKKALEEEAYKWSIEDM